MKNHIHKIFAIILIMGVVFFCPLAALADDGGFSFAAMCDSRGDYNGVNVPVLKFLTQNILENRDVKLLVFPGDLINGSVNSSKNYGQLLQWKKVMAPVYKSARFIGPKVLVSIGNHEIATSKAVRQFKKLFPMPKNGPRHERGFTYSYDYGDIHFVSVMTDRCQPRLNGYLNYVNCYDWLEKDLKDARKRGAKHIFVFGHQPAFPISAHIKDGLPNARWARKVKTGRTPMTISGKPDPDFFKKQRDKFWNILKKHKVDAYICGHEHCYGRQKVDGVWQILVGGAGAPLYSLNPRQGQWGYNRRKWYYQYLDYPHGPQDKCQASNDFVGGKWFSYAVFKVKNGKVEVTVWGVSPKKGNNRKIRSDAKMGIKDRFTL